MPIDWSVVEPELRRLRNLNYSQSACAIVLGISRSAVETRCRVLGLSGIAGGQVKPATDDERLAKRRVRLAACRARHRATEQAEAVAPLPVEPEPAPPIVAAVGTRCSAPPVTPRGRGCVARRVAGSAFCVEHGRAVYRLACVATGVGA